MKNSDGYYHELSAITVTVLCGISAIFLIVPAPLIGIGIFLGSVCGLFIDPDLDSTSTTRAEYRAHRTFTRIPGAIFQAYFTFYAAICGGHRSKLSHGGPPPLGWLRMILVATPFRMLYSLWWLVLLGYLRPSLWQLYGWLGWQFWIGLYVGWASQDFVHWRKDYL